MADKLLDQKNHNLLIHMIRNNIVESKNIRIGFTRYTIKDVKNTVLAVIEVDSDYGAINIEMDGKQIVFITYNESKANSIQPNILDIVKAAYDKYTDQEKKISTFKKAAAELGLNQIEVNQILKTALMIKSNKLTK